MWSHPGRAPSSLGRLRLPALGACLCLAASSCASVPEPDPELDALSPSAEVGFAPELWRDHVDSPDADVRLRVAESIPADPGDDGAGVLEYLATGEPDPRVRERAVVSYGSIRGREAIPFLRDVALSHDDDRVTEAAFAELGRVRAELNEPPRGFLDVHLPESFTVGEDFDLTITLGSTEDVEEARLGVRLPRALVPVSDRAPAWRGPLRANHPETLVIRLRASGPVDPAGIRASLHLAYPEPLDTEELRSSHRVWTEGGEGRFAETGTLVETVEMTPLAPGR